MATNYSEYRTLDIAKRKHVDPIILRHGETGLTNIVGTIMYDEVPYDLTGFTIKFCTMNKAGQITKETATLTNATQGIATYTVTNKVTSIDGELKVAYFELTKGNNLLTTQSIPIMVLRDADITADEAEAYQNQIDSLVSQLETALSKANTATSSANSAASAATTATTNAKSATTSANNAASAANTAASSANTAAGKANTAADAANAAKTAVDTALARYKTIKSSKVDYQLGTSGTTAPTGTWSSTIPTIEQGKYLWVRLVVTFGDKDNANAGTETVLIPAYQGRDGSFAGEDRMTKLEEKVNSINDYTTGINLLRGTRDFPQGTIQSKYAGTSSLWDDGISRSNSIYEVIDADEPNEFSVIRKIGGKQSSVFLFPIIPWDAVDGETLTFSCEVMFSKPLTNNVNIARISERQKNGTEHTNIKYISSSDIGSYQNIPTNKWIKLVHHFNDQINVNEDNIFLFGLYNNSSIETDVFYRKPKLEVGRIENPIWSASPFDDQYGKLICTKRVTTVVASDIAPGAAMNVKTEPVPGYTVIGVKMTASSFTCTYLGTPSSTELRATLYNVSSNTVKADATFTTIFVLAKNSTIDAIIEQATIPSINPPLIGEVPNLEQSESGDVDMLPEGDTELPSFGIPENSDSDDVQTLPSDGSQLVAKVPYIIRAEDAEEEN